MKVRKLCNDHMRKQIHDDIQMIWGNMNFIHWFYMKTRKQWWNHERMFINGIDFSCQDLFEWTTCQVNPGCTDIPEVPRPYKCWSKYSRVDTHNKSHLGDTGSQYEKPHTEKTLRSWASDIDFKHIQHKNWWEVECWRRKQESEMQKKYFGLAYFKNL